MVGALEFHHNYRTEDIENWIVFEKDIKVAMIQGFIEQKRLKDEARSKE